MPGSGAPATLDTNVTAAAGAAQMQKTAPKIDTDFANMKSLLDKFCPPESRYKDFVRT
jgi:hypothetical protein